MNHSVWIALLGIWLGFVTFFILRTQTGKREGFVVGYGDDLPEIQSTPIDLVTKYPNGYYNELDNATYQSALQKAFSGEKTCGPLRMALRMDDWVLSESHDVLKQAYVSQVIPSVRERINQTPDFFKGATGKIEIAYENIKSVSAHINQPDTYLVLVELVLYRKGKYHGKHVELNIIMQWKKKEWSYHVVSAEVLGILFEDQIVMQPVTARNPIAETSAAFDPNPFVLAPSILMSNEDILQLVQKQSIGNQKRAETELAILQQQ